MAKTISEFSILDALNALRISIPQWNERLDQLNGQIALRQIELARLEQTDRPRTQPSIKNKGSTESLRPKDGDDNPFHAAEDEDAEAIQLNPFEKSESGNNGILPSQRSNSSRVVGAAAARTPPPTKTATFQQSPGMLKRQLSHPSPSSIGRNGPNVLRKRKTESLASGESLAPKYRTRSMIIVYYDSAVQTAFEELVKFVSGSRNSMRRGKMAAKMAEMKRAAEMEFAEEEDEDEEEDDSNDLTPESGSLKVGQKGGPVVAADPSTPKLNYRSTRQMGPPKSFGRPEYVGSTLSVGLLRGNRRGGDEDIFDELDKGLEWCQSQCEQGAHHFLREGQCTTEIANIKKKLAEVKQVAEREMEKQEKEEALNPTPPAKTRPRQQQGLPRTRELKTAQTRKDFDPPSELEVDDMEVDDEGVDDLELPTKIVFKRSGDVAM